MRDCAVGSSEWPEKEGWIERTQCEAKKDLQILCRGGRHVMQDKGG